MSELSEPAEPTTTAAEAIAPALAEAAALGLDFRPISGLPAKRASRLGIDLDQIGRASDSALPDDDYHEQAMLAAWLLCAPEEEISTAIAAKTVTATAEAWEARSVPSLVHLKVAYRALMSRWIEYRVELDRIFGPAK